MQSMVRQSFARGMLLEMSDNVAPLDAVRYVNNMIPRPLGAMTTRWGRQRRYGIDPASSVVRTLDLFRYRASTGDWYDVFVNERASDNAIGYVGSGGWTNVATGLTKGGTTVAMQVRDRLLLANGSDAVKCYVYASSTHTVRDVGPGSGPAATAASPSSGGSLSLSTAYNWRVTALLGSDGETNPGSASADRTPTTGNQTVAISWSAITPPAGMTVTGYRIWRRATGVWNTWYLVAQVGSGVTSYSDSKADTDVYAAGGGKKIATNLGAPPTGSTGVAWWDYESRSVAWVGSTLYLSEINAPETFKTQDDAYDGTNVREFFDLSGNNPSNPILAVRPYDRYLYVFCQFGVRIITATGDATLPYTASTVVGSSDHGVMGPRSVVVTDTGDVYYLSQIGLRTLRGRVDVSVEQDSSRDTLGLLMRPGAVMLGPSLDGVATQVPRLLRGAVRGAYYDGIVWFSLARQWTGENAPDYNNDVLMFDTKTNSFIYQKSANLSGFCVANDSSEGYRLISSSSVAGMVFNEMVVGKATDDMATGAYATIQTTPITWTVDDFGRTLADYDTGVLRRFTLDAMSQGASSGNTSIVATLKLDGARVVTSKSLGYTSGGLRVWADRGRLDLLPTSKTLAQWRAVTDGAFGFSVNGSWHDLGAGIDFSACTSMTEVAAALQTAMRTAVSTVLVFWLGTQFRFAMPVNTGSTVSVDGVRTNSSAPSKTNISTAAYLGGPGFSYPVAAITQTVLTWGIATDSDDARRWSSVNGGRNQARVWKFSGERAQIVKTTLSGSDHATIYGYRLDFDLLRPENAGVL